MPVKHKIIVTYTKDLSVEIPDVQTLLLARERISKYKITLDITSKPLKNKMIEINTRCKFQDKNESKKKSHFEIAYSTVIKIIDKTTIWTTPEMKAFAIVILFYLYSKSYRFLGCGFGGNREYARVFDSIFSLK